MHELGLATQIYDACRASLEERGRGRICSVRVAVGELAAVEPDLLKFAWEAIIQETADAGAAMDIEWHPAQQVCSRCHREVHRSAGGWERLCPECEGQLHVRGGQELDILDIRVELEEG